jgi:hypothetical protein
MAGTRVNFGFQTSQLLDWPGISHRQFNHQCAIRQSENEHVGPSFG